MGVSVLGRANCPHKQAMLGQLISRILAGLGMGGPAKAATPAAPTSRADQVIDIAAEKITEPSEGTFLKPYQDPGGVWTIGTGATRDLAGKPVTAATPPITMLQNQVLLHRDVLNAFDTVSGDVMVPLTEDEEAALTDFVFNDGAGNFAKSSVLRDLNAGNYQAAANDLLLWDHAGGVVLAGLVKRCALRRTLFLTPDDKLSTQNLT